VLMERSSRFLWELNCGAKDQTLFEEALQREHVTFSRDEG
jgi:hypothetical protein